jgi:hypothetical protein
MAVYQGARRRAPLPLGLDALARRAAEPRAGVDRARSGRSGAAKGATNRARAATGGRAARVIASHRPSSVGIALGAIVLVFSAAFLSLSQSVRVAATGYDIVRLVSEHDRLQAIRQDLQSDVQRLRSEPAIRKEALDSGLGQLGAPLVVPAR